MTNPPVVVALLLLRVVVGVTMILHGYNHWRGGGKIAGTGRWFSGLGLRHGEWQAWASVVTEIGAGSLLILGFLTPLASAAIISVMLVAGLLAHRKNGFFVFKDGYEYVLVLAVVCLLLGITGPGQVSLDNAFGTSMTGWLGGGIALIVAVLAVGGLLGTFYRPEPPSGSAAPSAGSAAAEEPAAQAGSGDTEPAAE